MTAKTMSLVAFLLLLPVQALAEGEACESDRDCAVGEFCAAAPCTCACPGCEPGAECPPCECPPCDGGMCMKASVDGPVSGDCEVDADCPLDFACEQVNVACASVPPCPPCACPTCTPGQECPPCECPTCPEPPPCDTSTTYGVCVFQPRQCASDADCGEGFECEEQEACSGGGGCVCASCACAACPPGEDCPPCDCPTEPQCDCPEPTEPTCNVVGSFCVPAQTPCETDDDCLAGWHCAGFFDDCLCPACACAAPACEEGQECPEPVCDCGDCDCGTTSGQGYCLPEGWGEVMADYAAAGEQSGMVRPGMDPTAPGGPAAPTDGSDGGNSQTGGTGSTSADESGCAAGGGTTSGILFALLALAALLYVSRVRNRA